MKKNLMQRLKFIVSGQVQGVGFRPFVFRLAHQHSLTGTVCNTHQGVKIEVQGSDDDLCLFKKNLQTQLPPLARITSLIEENTTPVPEEKTFYISDSSNQDTSLDVLVSPDTATCKDCVADINETSGRRNAYPFTNCTNCGPRYTIISSLPYDRPYTTMSCFPMCEDCMAEYKNPSNRRFHAQPNACPKCGPQVWLTDNQGKELARGNDALHMLACNLADGKIAAIKGLGGFHLACNALDKTAIAELRARKQRPLKPLAIMALDLDTAKKLAYISKSEETALSSPQAPIVLCQKNPDFGLPEKVAPKINQIGIMLPYTPLHHILFSYYAAEIKQKEKDQPVSYAALVMTSGNRSNEPIAIGNREALTELSDLADIFLLHDRDILIRADDSVVRADIDDGLHFYRRARGFAPLPIEVGLLPCANSAPGCTLGMGAELKNTICFARTSSQSNSGIISGFVSQHIGDVTEAGTARFMRQLVSHLSNLLTLKPQLIVRDLHPDYISSVMADELGQELGIPVTLLQHHYAHAFSVLYENSHQGEALCLCLDGSGFGADQSIWGGELIRANTLTGTAERIGHIARTLTPGGDAAAKEPWRMAQAYMYETGCASAWFHNEFAEQSELLNQVMHLRLNCPLNSSTGRLFDAIAGLVRFGSQSLALPLQAGQTGIFQQVGAITYEGQAALWLENIQDKSETYAYPCPVHEHKNSIVLNTLELFSAAYDDALNKTSAAIISRRFHLGLAQGLCKLAEAGAQATGISTVGLSGGVMHNATLAALLPAQLRKAKLTPLQHKLLPPGDGCISFGQAVWGIMSSK